MAAQAEPAAQRQPAPAFRTVAQASALWPEVADYLAHLRIERGSSANTLASYERDLARYAAHLHLLGLQAPAQIDSGHISEYLQAVTTGADGGTALAERSVARMLAAVRGLHKYWAQEGRTGYDAAAEVTAPKLAQSLPKALSTDQVGQLIETPSPAQPLGLRDRALLEFLYATGARITEAVSLDVDDVHAFQPAGEQGLVLVRVTGKGNKQRMVPLGRMAQKALGDYLSAGRPALAEKSGRRSSAALFLNKLGGRLSRQSAWEVLKKTAEAAGITAEVSPHTLRHSCATHMLEGGADIRTVQELLGHASVTTTQIYTKVTAESLREVYASAHPRAR
ncbi:site-specific tyrosine recombinase XerD [Nesterenkonia alkaliphila]|uniref:Tyrosine recombinase XerC n=1 Tax=Nesterenkonia alkaliphila TaxID=1463631 RepID=A0A7K1UHL1_9MICC|nr:site-specific tyrosine recombinase XerD [Nesterenkonia alkaliphila]MVT25958.1 site-specific tyrosine recombinase XerD [Nesterenkonia alkaliphila]GFZ95719.1 tyrosine recombinase XerD [Nesterenkonia alkaliphila]